MYVECMSGVDAARWPAGQAAALIVRRRATAAAAAAVAAERANYSLVRQ